MLHWQKGVKWARLSSGGIPAGGVRGGSQMLVGVGSPKKTGREAPGVRAAKSSESRKGE